MSTKAEGFLNLLLWFGDQLTRPTFRNLTDSYEHWLYQQEVERRMPEFERHGFVEVRKAWGGERLCRLTTKGRLCALGGRDPQAHWSRKWDGQWRVVLFDVPAIRDSQRRKLRRYLHSRWFGCLQGSVWVTPDPLKEEKEILRGAKVDAGSLLLLEGRPCAGESDADIAMAAWDFARINEKYLRLMEILNAKPAGRVKSESQAAALARWASAEHLAWLEAVSEDPLLPEQLLPPGYMGKIAWRRRIEVLKDARLQVKSFRGA